MNKFLFVGLGNPGPEFQGSRHNLGIEALRSWADAPWDYDEKIAAEVATIIKGQATVYCLFPHTYMNESGGAVINFLKYHPIDLKNIVLLHDDLELPFGEIKLVAGGSAKGHNGVRSVQEKLGSQEISRLRLGIGRPQGNLDAKDFVLAKFTPDEQSHVKAMVEKAVSLLAEKIS